MANLQHLEKLRPLGKLEQVSAVCHHLGFFNNVGVSARYRASTPGLASQDVRRLVFAAVRAVVQQHRILSAIPVDEDSAESYFAALPTLDLTKSITFLDRHETETTYGAEDTQLDALLETQHNTNFKQDYGRLPFWRLVILQEEGTAAANTDTKRAEFTASFIYHHAIGDGMSGLVFHNAFHEALDAVSSMVSSTGPNGDANNTDPTDPMLVPDASVAVLPPLEALHPLPANTEATPPPTPPADPLQPWTGNPIQLPCVSRWRSLHIAPSVSRAFFRDCKAHKTSVTSALASVIAKTLFGILPPTTAGRLTCIIPVSLRPWLKVPRTTADSAIGTFFDAAKVQFLRPSAGKGGAADSNEEDSIWAGADKASAAISSYLANVSPTGEPYTAVAAFKNLVDLCPLFASLVGTPRDAAFEVTNIGQFPAKKDDADASGTSATAKPVSWQVGQVVLSRSSVASGAAVTISVATGGDGSMTIGFSWQEGVVADEDVEKLVHGVHSYFERCLQ